MNIDEVTSGSGDELTPATLASYLANLSTNSASSPHNIALKVSSNEEFQVIKSALLEAPNKYINLDLTGSTVTSIENNAFYGCTSLVSIIIPNNITSIGLGAFEWCENFVRIIIPDSVTSIEKWAFAFCPSLTSVTIGNGVTSIGDDAFNYCTSLASVTFQGTIPSSGFSVTAPFPGYLRSTFYETDKTNGTPGTYTTANPGRNSTWTKQ
jgi:hypothetical protein